jgi:biotin carboxyl carrier protein
VADVVSEMAANVWKVVVRPDDTVAAGDPLVILESMKMEIPVEAPPTGPWPRSGSGRVRWSRKAT